MDSDFSNKNYENDAPDNNENEDDYVIPPPSYKIEDQKSLDDDRLLEKLRLIIHKDLQQIHGVYDDQISELTREKDREIRRIEEEYSLDVDDINKQRGIDVSKYNKCAEKRINNLIITMNTPVERKQGLYEIFLGLLRRL